jgi:ComF family protein
LVHQLKFRGKLQFGRLLGDLMADMLLSVHPEWPDILIPVPLHPSRLRERGFNQAQEIARPVARRLQLPLAARAVERQFSTAPQTGLPARIRRRNLRGAFRVRESFAGLKVALLDDVITTGSTVEELARVVVRAGALDVQVWAFARA